jgi:hypothetical protein
MSCLYQVTFNGEPGPAQLVGNVGEEGDGETGGLTPVGWATEASVPDW